MNKYLAASVRVRLLNIAKAQGADFNQVLVRFALERILYAAAIEYSRTSRPLQQSQGALIRGCFERCGRSCGCEYAGPGVEN